MKKPVMRKATDSNNGSQRSPLEGGKKQRPLSVRVIESVCPEVNPFGFKERFSGGATFTPLRGDIGCGYTIT
jgi:hypothetical protein